LNFDKLGLGITLKIELVAFRVDFKALKEVEV
jgi:hypothetical protein